MRAVTKSQTGTGSTTVVPMNTEINPFNVGFGVVVSGTVNYTIQHTFSDVFDSAVTPVWFSHPAVASQTTNQDGNYAFPVSGIRLTVNSGTGTATVTIIQAG